MFVPRVTFRDLGAPLTAVVIAAMALSTAWAATTADRDVKSCMAAASPAGIDACTRLLKLKTLDNANRAAVFYNRGNAYNAAGQLDAAITDYGAAIALKPDLFQAYNNRGSAHRAKGQSADAIADFTAALKLRPGDTSTLINRAVALGDVRRYADAIADFAAAARAEPSNASAHSGLCWARALGDAALNAGLTDCNETLRLDPSNASALASRGLIELRLGDYSNAVTDYDKSLAKNPKDASALYGRGLAKLRQNDSAANEDIAAAKVIDPRVELTFARLDLRP